MVATPQPLAADRQEQVGRRIALLSVSIGVILAIAKIWIGVRAGSASLVSDGFEAAGDVLSSGFVYAGLWLASKPPDFEHPYGHGRYETLAGLAVGAMLLLTGVLIFLHGLRHATERAVVQPYALYPLAAAVLLKTALAVLKFRVATRIASTALNADAWHDITDLGSTGIAIAAIVLTLTDSLHFASADHIGGMLIGVIIFFLAVQVIHGTVGQLLDTMPEPEKIRQIRNAGLDVEGVLGIEKCYARRTGLKYHVDLHLEVDPEMTVRESHDIATQVKHSITRRLPWVAGVLVHVEPFGLASVESHAPSHWRWLRRRRFPSAHR